MSSIDYQHRNKRERASQAWRQQIKEDIAVQQFATLAQTKKVKYLLGRLDDYHPGLAEALRVRAERMVDRRELSHLISALQTSLERLDRDPPVHTD